MDRFVPALVSDSGLDTVRFRWRNPDGDSYYRFKAQAKNYQHGQHGEIRVPTELGQVGMYPDGLVFMESRVSALVDGSRDSHRLGEVHELHSAERVARDVAFKAGAHPGFDDARLGRLDFASELTFRHGEAGQAFLHALSNADIPWCKSRTDGVKGRGIETVSFHGVQGKTVYLRAYDKGVESDTAAPGIRIRVERQKRWRKVREPFMHEVSGADLHSWYVGREFARLQDLPTAYVVDVAGAIDVLWESCESPEQMERMVAYVVAGRIIDYHPKSRLRRAAELRSLGVVIDYAQQERLEVPVGRYLQSLASAWAA